jgi:SAM-dependent methyltransferase
MEASTETAIDERPQPAPTGRKYDDPSFAERYASYWEPVLAPAGRRLLDALEQDGLLSDPAPVPSGNLTLLDVGTGTGLLALDAAQRWPRARIIGVDPSRAMVSVARRRATQIATTDGRLELLEAPADRLPFADQAFDLVVSSFVFQLVPDRLAALRETYRILRPGGLIGYVTWIKTDELFAPRAIVDEELGVQAGNGWSGSTSVAGDVASPGAAASQLRRAGFRRVRAWQEELARRWTPAEYLEYIEACRDTDALASLDDEARSALLERIRRRLAALGPADFRWAAPIFFAIGRRPA